MGKAIKVDGVTWIKSKARRMLYDGIIDGKIKNGADPEDVYQSDPEFLKWPRHRFIPNLASLKEIIARDYGRMMNDLKNYQHDVKKLVDQRVGEAPRKVPWHKSEAKKLLEDEIDKGVLEQDPKPLPHEMYNAKAEYRQFLLEEFRNHIYQEVKRREKMETRAKFGKKRYRNAQETVDKDMALMVKKYAAASKPPNKKQKEAPKPAIEDILSANAYAKPMETKQQKTASRRSAFGRKPAPPIRKRRMRS